MISLKISHEKGGEKREGKGEEERNQAGASPGLELLPCVREARFQTLTHLSSSSWKQNSLPLGNPLNWLGQVPDSPDLRDQPVFGLQSELG